MKLESREVRDTAGSPQVLLVLDHTPVPCGASVLGWRTEGTGAAGGPAVQGADCTADARLRERVQGAGGW